MKEISTIGILTSGGDARHECMRQVGDKLAQLLAEAHLVLEYHRNLGLVREHEGEYPLEMRVLVDEMADLVLLELDFEFWYVL